MSDSWDGRQAYGEAATNSNGTAGTTAAADANPFAPAPTVLPGGATVPTLAPSVGPDPTVGTLPPAFADPMPAGAPPHSPVPLLPPPAAPPVSPPPTTVVMSTPTAPVAPAAAPMPAAPPAPPAPPAAASATAAVTGRGTEEDSSSESLMLTDLLIAVLERGASDLHLTISAPPVLRINGQLAPMTEFPEMTLPVLQRMLYSIITQKQREKFEENLELDFAYAVPGKARFRVNIYKQRDAIGAAFRLIPFEIKKLEELGVPPSVANFAMLPRGFVLVTGPTGSGKSTTLAAIVDLANRQRRDHIMTVEDPIEFLHHHQNSLVNQREVGEDTHSFQNALKHVLRQDPDIILVGEMRDLETISVALTAAETGHLVFATLHTQDAAQTIDRVIDVFPPHQQQQIRVQLAGALQGVVCQTLVPDVRRSGPGRRDRGADRHTGHSQPHP